MVAILGRPYEDLRCELFKQCEVYWRLHYYALVNIATVFSFCSVYTVVRLTKLDISETLHKVSKAHYKHNTLLCVLFCPLHFWFVMRFLVEYVSGGCHLRSFCEIAPLLDIRVPIKFYLYLLILSILCHFFIEKCEGASFVWQDLWENWISWEGLLWFTLHWWEGWPGTVTAGIALL